METSWKHYRKRYLQSKKQTAKFKNIIEIHILLSMLFSLILFSGFLSGQMENILWIEVSDVFTACGKVLSYLLFVYFLCMDYDVIREEKELLFLYEILGMDGKTAFLSILKKTLPNITAASLFGYFGGILLSKMLFSFSVFQPMKEKAVYTIILLNLIKNIAIVLCAFISALFFYQIRCFRMPLIMKSKESHLPEKAGGKKIMIFSGAVALSGIFLLLSVSAVSFRIKDYAAAFYQLPLQLTALCLSGFFLYIGGSRFLAVYRKEKREFRKDGFFMTYFLSLKRRRRVTVSAVISFLIFLAAFFLIYMLSHWFSLPEKVQYLFPNHAYYRNQRMDVEKMEDLENQIRSIAQENEVPISSFVSYRYVENNVSLAWKEQKIVLHAADRKSAKEEFLSDGRERAKNRNLTCIMLEDFNRIKETGKEKQLGKQEVFLITQEDMFSGAAALSFSGENTADYTIKEVMSVPECYLHSDDLILVVSDEQEWRKISNYIDPEYPDHQYENYNNAFIINFGNISEKEEIKAAAELNRVLSDDPEMFMEVQDRYCYCREQEKIYGVYIVLFGAVGAALFFCIAVLERAFISRERKEQEKERKYFYEQGMEENEIAFYYWKIIRRRYVLSVMMVMLFLFSVARTIMYMLKIDGNIDTRFSVCISILLIWGIMIIFYYLLYFINKKSFVAEMLKENHVC